ncbi:UDP-N-acetylglucosamine 4,6-dehydratase [Methylophaga frappieri]|uniref:UDP-N-acetylglucosamine 4,6-dehydratase n=1 Tax=Methylophaga frappieri (strain ATCC BAA-2434 / DSM 25690 / JAM7) TaxID=754477 RepID=I1YG73_METFJ|nr:nucleoside-diphosphate sugar epimerase/dehydratase [Methylophaga frappieri]AFJ01916.1 UDP-N-acetylglucosamine 4,6-dehydratase [Methylophaga frappieri]
MRRLALRLSDWFLARPRMVKRLITLSVDYTAVMLALWLAYCLRLSTIYTPPPQQWWLFLLSPLLAIPVFARFGLYRTVIRYIGLDAIWAILKAITLYTLILAVVILLAREYAGLVPRTIYAINAILLVLMIGGSRIMARWAFTRQQISSEQRRKQAEFLPPVIIYGAGAAGAQLAAILKMGNQLRPVAFIDDDQTLHHQQINGLTVYAPSALSSLIKRFETAELLLAMPSVSRRQRQQILQTLESYPVRIRTLPGMSEIAQGKISVSDIREVEIGDLLGREPVAPDTVLLTRNITDKTVMVTGAGGSIGSELCRQIIQQQPRQLVLYEISEYALYEIEKSLHHLGRDVPIVSLLGSVLDKNRLQKACQHFGVQTIYHAAAYKHVPMVEKNITEGVRNNVLGTLNTALAAMAAEVETMVLISTDKAVRPTNTMGASKRFAELILQALATNEPQSATRFTMVRFGNVLGSSGSVIPLFRQQIANGGPVTVTHPDIIRYFMTIPEAAELVIQAGAMGEGGDVFVLDMGEPVKIIDLARRLVHLSGLSIRDETRPDGDIEIQFTGLRPGEKLYEELLIGSHVAVTRHPKIMRAEEQVIIWPVLQDILDQLSAAIEQDDYGQIRALLLTHIDGFTPQSDPEDWLQSQQAMSASGQV